MKPAPRDHQDLLAWVAAIIEREHGRETTGEVRVQMHGGVIQRVRIEATETPGVDTRAK
jgi:hypothetical protein